MFRATLRKRARVSPRVPKSLSGPDRDPRPRTFPRLLASRVYASRYTADLCRPDGRVLRRSFSFRSIRGAPSRERRVRLSCVRARVRGGFAYKCVIQKRKGQKDGQEERKKERRDDGSFYYIVTRGAVPLRLSD